MKKDKEHIEMLVKRNMAVIAHFFDRHMGYGWPLNREEVSDELLETLDCLYINENNRVALKNNFQKPYIILSVFWELMYRETNKEYMNMYSKVKKALDGV